MDLLAGRVDIAFNNPANSLSLIHSGKLKALAVASGYVFLNFQKCRQSRNSSQVSIRTAGLPLWQARCQQPGAGDRPGARGGLRLSDCRASRLRPRASSALIFAPQALICGGTKRWETLGKTMTKQTAREDEAAQAGEGAAAAADP
ncbi:hypothetical protein, partial [Bradyrhizobium sp.]|uniref:hypothetical protein n=1 Tax=Bradyrhizobium sp. TaxID=376 RepID=UPI003C38A8C7